MVTGLWHRKLWRCQATFLSFFEKTFSNDLKGRIFTWFVLKHIKNAAQTYKQAYKLDSFPDFKTCPEHMPKHSNAPTTTCLAWTSFTRMQFIFFVQSNTEMAGKPRNKGVGSNPVLETMWYALILVPSLCDPETNPPHMYPEICRTEV